MNFYQFWVPHPRRVLVFAARVGFSDLNFKEQDHASQTWSEDNRKEFDLQRINLVYQERT
jgi:hypothetical protein